MTGQITFVRGRSNNPNLIIIHARPSLPLNDPLVQFRAPLRENNQLNELQDGLRALVRALFKVADDAIDVIVLKPHEIIIEKAELYTLEEVEPGVMRAIEMALGSSVNTDPLPISPANLRAAAEAIMARGALGVAEALRLTNFELVTAMLRLFFTRCYPNVPMPQLVGFLLGDLAKERFEDQLITAAMALL